MIEVDAVAVLSTGWGSVWREPFTWLTLPSVAPGAAVTVAVTVTVAAALVPSAPKAQSTICSPAGLDVTVQVPAVVVAATGP